MTSEQEDEIPQSGFEVKAVYDTKTTGPFVIVRLRDAVVQVSPDGAREMAGMLIAVAAMSEGDGSLVSNMRLSGVAHRDLQQGAPLEEQPRETLA